MTRIRVLQLVSESVQCMLHISEPSLACGFLLAASKIESQYCTLGKKKRKKRKKKRKNGGRVGWGQGSP